MQEKDFGSVAVILASSILGILGSYGVAWFGIRINTTANSRAAFAALKGNSLKTLFIPLQAGMSIGLLLVCVELVCHLGNVQNVSAAAGKIPGGALDFDRRCA